MFEEELGMSVITLSELEDDGTYGPVTVLRSPVELLDIGSVTVLESSVELLDIGSVTVLKVILDDELLEVGGTATNTPGYDGLVLFDIGRHPKKVVHLPPIAA